MRRAISILTLLLAGCAAPGEPRPEPGPTMDLRSSVEGLAVVVADRALAEAAAPIDSPR